MTIIYIVVTAIALAAAYKFKGVKFTIGLLVLLAIVYMLFITLASNSMQ